MFQYSFVCLYLVFSLTSLLDLGGQVVLLSGVTHRIAQMAEHLIQLQSDWDTSSLQVCHTCSILLIATNCIHELEYLKEMASAFSSQVRVPS